MATWTLSQDIQLIAEVLKQFPYDEYIPYRISSAGITWYTIVTNRNLSQRSVAECRIRITQIMEQVKKTRTLFEVLTAYKKTLPERRTTRQSQATQIKMEFRDHLHDVTDHRLMEDRWLIDILCGKLRKAPYQSHLHGINNIMNEQSSEAPNQSHLHGVNNVNYNKTIMNERSKRRSGVVNPTMRRSVCEYRYRVEQMVKQTRKIRTINEVLMDYLRRHLIEDEVNKIINATYHEKPSSPPNASASFLQMQSPIRSKQQSGELDQSRGVTNSRRRRRRTSGWIISYSDDVQYRPEVRIRGTKRRCQLDDWDVAHTRSEYRPSSAKKRLRAAIDMGFSVALYV